MDSTIITSVTETHVTLFKSVQQSLDATHWFLLFLGWMLYWFKSLTTARQVCPKGESYFPAWWSNNSLEIPISVISCLLLAIWSKQMPPTLMDMTGYVSITIAGYSSSSIVNGLITNVKPAFKKQTP